MAFFFKILQDFKTFFAHQKKQNCPISPLPFPKKVPILQALLSSSRTLLFSHCESTEEGTRNVVAECLGKLTLVDPLRLLPQLKVCVNSQALGISDSVCTTPEKFENVSLFLRSGLQATLIRYENGAFRKLSLNRWNLKTRASLLVWMRNILKTELFENDDIMVIK